MSTHDDAAHLALAARPVTVQSTDYARAETMMFIATHEAAGLKWWQISALLKAAVKDGAAVLAPSYKTKRRWNTLIADVDTANWAPALAPDCQGRTATAELSPEAWAGFETLPGLARKNGTGWPVKEAWRRIVDQKAARSWMCPGYRMAMRRWGRQDEVHKRALRMGVDGAVKSLIQYQPRIVEGMFAMSHGRLDGWEVKDRFRNGKIGYPWGIVYTDRASSRILRYAISDSENKEAIIRVFDNSDPDGLSAHGRSICRLTMSIRTTGPRPG
ncbi:hypothetical protein PE067_07710 [Paracoccus sp. DMF-8]|uniref:hypothetical protein n=1 Tax=Paracoccus sp. DMF-8 TaxID=3019445 RepID=UPI0023E82B8A|nr:hypothetical protein [Paracoccus sp. DMF-8]MDF3606026.1 hypothetical protein [Paracoccus sp. DMF-8]